MTINPKHAESDLKLVGRLRKHDRNQIALDMLDWAKKEDSVNLNAFCAMQELPTSKPSLWAKENDLFRQAYEIVKAHIAARREAWLNTGMLHVKAYDLNATVYDYFLKEEKRLYAEFETLLKTQTENNVPDDIKDMFKSTMDQLSSLQSERKK